MKKQLIALLLLVFASNGCRAWFDFEEIERHMEEQMKHMEKIMKETRKQMSSMSRVSMNNRSPISLKQENDALSITISDVESDTIDARLNDENTQLTLITPRWKVLISAYKNIIGIEAQETIQDKKTTDTDAKEKTMQFMGSSVSHMQQSVDGIPLLEKQTITYDESKKSLEITIPLEKKNGKVIQINKINSPDIAPEA